MRHAATTASVALATALTAACATTPAHEPAQADGSITQANAGAVRVAGAELGGSTNRDVLTIDVRGGRRGS